MILSLLLACSGSEPAADPAGALPAGLSAEEQAKAQAEGFVPPGDGAPPPGEATAAALPAGAPPAGVDPAAPPPAGAPDPAGAVPPPPDATATAVGGAPVGGRPTPLGFQVAPGNGVTVSGSVTWTGGTKGTLHLDFLRNGEAGSPPQLLHSLTLKAGGPFSVQVPKDTGKMSLVAFVDTNDNGPDQGEPMAPPIEVSVAGADVTGIQLTVAKGTEVAKTLADGTQASQAPGAAQSKTTP